MGTIDRGTLDRLIALGRSRGELTAEELRAVLPVDTMPKSAEARINSTSKSATASGNCVCIARIAAIRYICLQPSHVPAGPMFEVAA
jgi:hypothetical protein